MKPFLKYFGSKQSLAKRYGPPRRNVVIEPFAGGAGYSCYWQPQKVILVEKWERLVNVWRWLIQATRDDIMDLDPHCPDVRDTGYPQPVKDFIGWNFGRGDGQPRNRMTDSMRRSNRTAAGNELKASVWCPRKQQQIADQIHLINDWEIIHGDYTLAPAIDAHYHVDPPYQFLGRTGYPAAPPRDIDFAALAEWCRAKDSVDVCEGTRGGRRPDWLPFETLKTTRHGQDNRDREELIWRRETKPNTLVKPR